MTRRPTYAQMCAEAIATLQRRRGSSVQAIAKFLQGRYGAALPATAHFRRLLSLRLKRLVHLSLLLKTKASYKLTPPARRRFLHQSSKPRRGRRQSAVAPLLDVSMPDAFDSLLTPDALDSASDAGVSELENTSSSMISTPSGKSSSSNSATRSVSPRKRCRSFLKQLLVSWHCAHPVLHMTVAMTTPAGMRRRRLRRYGASLLRPI